MPTILYSMSSRCSYLSPRDGSRLLFVSSEVFGRVDVSHGTDTECLQHHPSSQASALVRSTDSANLERLIVSESDDESR
jgi:hypothetical protein